MLFTTSITWQYREVYEDEIQEWIRGVDRVCNGKTNHDRRAVNRFVKKMGLTIKLKKRTYDLLDCFCKKHC